MKLNIAVAGLVFIGTLSGCSLHNGKTVIPFITNNNTIKETEIFLQEPYSRVVARCYASAEDAAIACAKKFEQKGYVRLKNIPYRVARYDFLTSDTYPSRRWRFNDIAPRW